MLNTRLMLLFVLVGAGPALFAASAPGLKSTGSTVQMIAVMPEKLSLQPAAPSIGFLEQGDGLARGEHPIVLTTRWNLQPSRTKVVVNAYFEDPSGSTIALGDISSSLPTDSAQAPPRSPAGRQSFFTRFLWSGVGGSGSGQEVFQQPLTPGVNDMSSRTDAIDFILGLNHRHKAAEADYQGVLTLVAQAY